MCPNKKEKPYEKTVSPLRAGISFGYGLHMLRVAKDFVLDYRKCLTGTLILVCGVTAISAATQRIFEAPLNHMERSIFALTLPFVAEHRNRLSWLIVGGALTVMLLSASWIGVLCGGITLLWAFSERLRKSPRIVLVLALALSIPMVGAFAGKSLLRDLEGYNTIWLGSVNATQDKVFGDGLGSFSKLPQNQPEARASNRWLKQAHSEFWQALKEIGYIGTCAGLFIYLLPYLWLKPSALQTAWACGGVLLFLDFPLHRPSTGLLFFILLLLVYGEGLWKKR